MIMRPLLCFASAVVSFATFCSPAAAWDYAGHRIVNQTALASLPADFPAFVREPAAAERIAFLAGEPDRWRNVTDLPIKHANGLDHYIDLEELPHAGLDPATVPSLRMEFALAFAAGRAAHADKFPAVDPTKNADHTREWPGFAPWAVAEYYGKLKSGFSYLKVYEELGTAEEIANARANLVYVMGVMGHIVGDLAQPLHTTVHHHGWAGENPHGYTQVTKIHSWIDGGLIARTGITVEDVRPGVQAAGVQPTMPGDDGRDPIFAAVMDYLVAQNARVEPLYQLEKAGKIGPESADLAEGRAFVCEQLRVGGEMLGTLWRTAWENTVPDVYLRDQLLKRRAGATPVAK
jgi:hypothetical protein